MSIFSFDKKKSYERMRQAGLRAKKRREERERKERERKAKLTATQAKALTSGTGVKFTKKK